MASQCSANFADQSDLSEAKLFWADLGLAGGKVGHDGGPSLFL